MKYILTSGFLIFLGSITLTYWIGVSDEKEHEAQLRAHEVPTPIIDKGKDWKFDVHPVASLASVCFHSEHYTMKTYPMASGNTVTQITSDNGFYVTVIGTAELRDEKNDPYAPTIKSK